MKRTRRVLPEAEAELQSAAVWHEEKRRALGIELGAQSEDVFGGYQLASDSSFLSLLLITNSMPTATNGPVIAMMIPRLIPIDSFIL